MRKLVCDSTFGIGLTLVTISLIAACGPSPVFKAEYERFRSIKVGMTEQEVRDRLGSPTHVYERRSAPQNYYVKGYSFKDRLITNKVLIYIGSEPIAYVYIDDQNKVEEVFVGGS
jgi:outer membrane protein assembly factor BamE (lipoprotein component of BamABCDE complex)